MILALRNLMNHRIRTALNIFAVTLAVVSVILLASLGSGLVATGEKAFEKSTMHIWITGRPVDLQTRLTNPGEAKVNDAHKMAADILKDPRVELATPMLTEMIYVYKEDERPRSVFGLGVATSGGMVVTSEGSNLKVSTHYNNGAYNGEWTREVLVDSRAATLLGVRVGDTVHAGKTLKDAANQQFRVVGITNSLTAFSANPTLIFPFSEFQDITGNHYYDSASMLIIRLADPEDADSVKTDLEMQYTEYMVNTNKELLVKIVRDNGLIIASAASIVLLAVLMGGALVVNTILLSINEKRKSIGIMQVIGMSRWSIMKSVGLEGAVITVLGGFSGCLASLLAVGILNRFIDSMVGFEDVLVMNEKFILGGFAMAVFLGLVTSLIVVLRLDNIDPIEQLRSV